MAGSAPVLIYHDVASPAAREQTGFPGPAAGLYKLTPEAFEAHLEAIAQHAGPDAAHPDRGRVTLTFDDGGASAPWVAACLERRGWRGVFFIVTGRIGTPGFASAEELIRLAQSGHVLGSHTDTHPSYMGRLSADVVGREWVRSRDALSDLLGTSVRWAAVPGGSVSPTVVHQAAAAGYERLYTSTPSVRPRDANGMKVQGRFSIWAADPPEMAGALAAAHLRPRARRWIGWQTKSAAKRVNPAAYEFLRRRLAERRLAERRKESSRAF
jgi:peptidoglycan/xylan/chitin deacetylase (PgdA/CDA1 family)